jgi:hypothetical protein
VISTVDPQARHTRKTSAHKRDGYKGHIAAEPESGLVTKCALTAASTPDGSTGVGLLAGEAPGLEVLGDSAYGGGQTRAALRAAGHTQTIKPLPLASAMPGGFTTHDFQIDRKAGTVRCPAGHTAPISASGTPALRATAGVARCVSAAPPPSMDARSRSTRMRTSCARPAATR